MQCFFVALQESYALAQFHLHTLQIQSFLFVSITFIRKSKLRFTKNKHIAKSLCSQDATIQYPPKKCEDHKQLMEVFLKIRVPFFQQKCSDKGTDITHCYSHQRKEHLILIKDHIGPHTFVQFLNKEHVLFIKLIFIERNTFLQMKKEHVFEYFFSE